MFTATSYGLAVLMCVVTMFCWGSWANTQKLAKNWPFQLFYWDYCIGVLLWTLVLALTLGSQGEVGRAFSADLGQASWKYLGYALLAGVIFNAANILLVAAIDIAGMSVAFPVGIGLALVLGVISTYWIDPSGRPGVLFAGVACVAAAIVVDAMAYRQLAHGAQRTSAKGIVLSVLSGVLMSQFFPFIARAMPPIEKIDDAATMGMLTPYTALFVFAGGLFLSSFVFNVWAMRAPFVGPPVPMLAYFTSGSFKLHAVGILGGVIWGVGMSFAVLAGDRAGYAISYGLGQGATMVASLWGVFVWREFQGAPPRAQRLVAAMFVLFVVGLTLIVFANMPTAVAGPSP